MTVTSAAVLLVLLAAPLLGGGLPVWRRWSQRGLHLAAALAAGIVSGSVLLHLVPELVEAAAETGRPGALWAATGGGFAAVFLFERLWTRRAKRAGEDGSHARHSVVWQGTFAGLSLHAALFGLGLAALDERVTPVLLGGLALHKLSEGFSLGTVMSLAGLGPRRVIGWLVLFALVTPVALLLGSTLGQGTSGAGSAILAGIAAGTFFYVVFCDLLPEAFHGEGPRWAQVGVLAAGFGTSALAEGPHGHAGALLVDVLGESWHLFVEMAPFLLVGFIAAGFLARVLDPERLRGWFAGRGAKSVALASVVGAPLPLCSCSVVPVGASLRRAGASRGATSAFLIATPETGVDSVAASWALLDPFMTIARPAAAIATAVVTGLVVESATAGEPQGDPGEELGSIEPECAKASCCGGEPEVLAPESGTDAGCGDDHGNDRPEAGLVRGALHHAFVEMIDDLALPLVAGVLLSGVIGALVPESFFEHALLSGSSGLFLMLAFGLPVYVCASASTPIAAALILKGLSPGAAMVFLLSGPATNLGSLAVIGRVLGKRALVVHVIVLALATLAIGFLVNWAYPALGITPSARAGSEQALLPAWLGYGSAAILGAALALSAFRQMTRRAPGTGDVLPSVSPS